MKKFTPILLALASIAVLSFKQSNSSEKSDAALSKNDIEILEIIERLIILQILKLIQFIELKH